MPIYEIRWTERKERIMAARTSAEAVTDLAGHFRPVEGFEVECLELREVAGDAGRGAEVGMVEWFDLSAGQPVLRAPAESWLPLWARGLWRVPGLLLQELRKGLEDIGREPERRRHAA